MKDGTILKSTCTSFFSIFSTSRLNCSCCAERSCPDKRGIVSTNRIAPIWMFFQVRKLPKYNLSCLVSFLFQSSMVTQILASKPTRLFIFLAGFFIANAMLAEFIGIKIFSLEKTFGFAPLSMTLFGVKDLGFNLTAGVLLWPVVFVMTDIINEYYGRKGVRFLSWLAVILIIYAFLIAFFAIQAPPNDWWQSISGVRDTAANSITDMNLAFKRIFGQGLWIIAGSVVAFLIGQVIDVAVFHKIKTITGEGKIWLRSTGSTVIS